jgi:hypothetical protein
MAQTGAQAMHGCQNCGGSTMLTGMDAGTTIRKCRKCGAVNRHTPPQAPPGQHGYADWDPGSVLSNEF